MEAKLQENLNPSLNIDVGLVEVDDDVVNEEEHLNRLEKFTLPEQDLDIFYSKFSNILSLTLALLEMACLISYKNHNDLTFSQVLQYTRQVNSNRIKEKYNEWSIEALNKNIPSKQDETYEPSTTCYQKLKNLFKLTNSNTSESPNSSQHFLASLIIESSDLANHISNRKIADKFRNFKIQDSEVNSMLKHFRKQKVMGQYSLLPIDPSMSSFVNAGAGVDVNAITNVKPGAGLQSQQPQQNNYSTLNQFSSNLGPYIGYNLMVLLGGAGQNQNNQDINESLQQSYIEELGLNEHQAGVESGSYKNHHHHFSSLKTSKSLSFTNKLDCNKTTNTIMKNNSSNHFYMTDTDSIHSFSSRNLGGTLFGSSGSLQNEKRLIYGLITADDGMYDSYANTLDSVGLGIEQDVRGKSIGFGSFWKVWTLDKNMMKKTHNVSCLPTQYTSNLTLVYITST